MAVRIKASDRTNYLINQVVAAMAQDPHGKCLVTRCMVGSLETCPAYTNSATCPIHNAKVCEWSDACMVAAGVWD